MDVKWLDDFLVLAECGNITRAARLRHTSQSGLSRRIQSLETWLGTALVDRQAARFRLTPAGRRFVPLAAHLRSTVAAARELCLSESTQDEAPLRLAVTEGVESGVLPALLARLKRAGFESPLQVEVVPAAQALAALEDGRFDLWLALQHPQLPLVMDRAAFECTAVARDRLSAFTGVDGMGRPLHALPGQREAPTPLLDHAGNSALAQVVGLVLSTASARTHLRRVCATPSLASLCAQVRQGLGIAFLPDSMVAQAVHEGALLRCDARWSTPLEVCLVRPRRPTAHAAAPRLWQVLAAALQRPGGAGQRCEFRIVGTALGQQDAVEAAAHAELASTPWRPLVTS